MSIPLNIHPELQSIKAHQLPKNRWALAANAQRFFGNWWALIN